MGSCEQGTDNAKNAGKLKKKREQWGLVSGGMDESSDCCTSGPGSNIG
jgi:hypothetical protein